MSTWKQFEDNPKTKEIFMKRSLIIKSIRDFFWLSDFLETDTLSASPFAGQEPYLEPMSVDIFDPFGKKFKYFLQTSPEYAMKKLLAGGFSKIFQICHCFRNNESFGGNHYPEFLMLEWYRMGDDYFKIMDDTENLFKFVAEKVSVDFLSHKNFKVSIKEKWDRLSMREVWQKYLDVDLNNFLTLESISELAGKLEFKVSVEDRYEDVFYKIFLNKIEPNLGLERPIFIYNYPSQMSALARLFEGDSRCAERFELYIAGMEIANAFGELLDGEEQKKRFLEEQEIRRSRSGEVFNIDEDLIRALGSLKDKNSIASGIALGVDRMVMLFTGVEDILETLLEVDKD